MSDDGHETVPEALEAGHRPMAIGDAPEDAEWSDYAWGHVPCPHCDAGMLIGVYDPEYVFDEEDGIWAIMAPGDGDD